MEDIYNRHMKVAYCRILLLLVFFLAHMDKLASQDAIFSQFYSTPLYLNPAFAGSGNDYRLVMNYRNQPFPDFGTFSTLNLAFDVQVPDLYGGLGFIVTSDHQGGMLMKNHINAIYAYHLQAGSNLFINFGAQAGYYRKDLRWNNLEFAVPETIPDETWTHAANFATGILVYNNWMYGGLAAHHLTRPRESFYDEFRLPMKYTAHLGAFLQPSETRGVSGEQPAYFISPNIIFQNQEAYNRINYGIYAGIQSLMAGVWYRQDLTNPNTLIFLIGMAVGYYRIGYSYDYSLSGYTDLNHGAHEISISFVFDNETRKLRRRILNCPGF